MGARGKVGDGRYFEESVAAQQRRGPISKAQQGIVVGLQKAWQDRQGSLVPRGKDSDCISQFSASTWSLHQGNTVGPPMQIVLSTSDRACWLLHPHHPSCPTTFLSSHLLVFSKDSANSRLADDACALFTAWGLGEFKHVFPRLSIW